MMNDYDGCVTVFLATFEKHDVHYGDDYDDGMFT